MPLLWPLCIALGLLVLSSVSKPVLLWFENDLRTGAPRAHFYSEEAWNNCASMAGEAKRQGGRYWTCHKPSRM